jgi:hypothetical protein
MGAMNRVVPIDSNEKIHFPYLPHLRLNFDSVPGNILNSSGCDSN